MRRKIIFLFSLLVWVFSPDVIAQTPGEIITLDLSRPTNPSSIELNKQGYWTKTYSNDFPCLDFGLFSFTHLLNGGGGTDVGGGMSYWDGFTYCTNGDTEDYGASGSSDGWVANQWGCMAGGGIQTNDNREILKDGQGNVVVGKGIPYLVAYWGYWIETMGGGAPCLQATFKDNASYEAVGVYISNHPWPYYGNIHGDGFARPFYQESDYFKLYIHGVNELGEDVGNPVEYTLAEYTNETLIQSPHWEWVDLSSLGTVNGFFFTMETSDADPIFGPNTAVYFCMDKLQVRVPDNGENIPPSRPANLQVAPTETTIALSWNASSDDTKVVGYHVYLNNNRVATVEETAYLFENLTPATSYKLGVEAFDDKDALSDKAITDVSTTDETPPTMPAHLEGIPTQTSIALSWEASSDNVKVTGYNIYLNGQREKKVTTTAYTLTWLDSATLYLVEVEALDATGNKSGKAALSISTLGTGGTSIPDNSAYNQSGIYYNPFADRLLIKTNQNGSTEIYNITGRQILSVIVVAGTNSIDVSHLPQGTYIVKHRGKVIKIFK
jgi:chitodextrinase